MTAIRKICLLGLGEVGTTLASDLAGRTDIVIKSWNLLFGEAQSRPSKALWELPHVMAADSATSRPW